MLIQHFLFFTIARLLFALNQNYISLLISKTQYTLFSLSLKNRRIKRLKLRGMRMVIFAHELPTQTFYLGKFSQTTQMCSGIAYMTSEISVINPQI